MIAPLIKISKCAQYRPSAAKALEGSIPLPVNINELSPIDVFGLVLLQRGGSSPFSKKFLYQCNAASTPCERLAKRLLSTCSSIQDNSSGVTVTLIFGLLSERILTLTQAAIKGLNPLSVNENEQPSVKCFGLSLQDYLGGCSPCFEFLSLVNARSIPCDKLANSLHSTIFSRNSIFSGEIVTFNETFFCFIIYNKDSCEVLYIHKDNRCFTKIIFVGDSQNDRKQPISARAEDNERGHDLFQYRRQGTKHSISADQDHVGIFSIDIRRHEGFCGSHDVGDRRQYLGYDLKENNNENLAKLRMDPPSSLSFVHDITSAAQAMEGSIPSPVGRKHKENAKNTHIKTAQKIRMKYAQKIRIKTAWKLRTHLISVSSLSQS